MGMNESQTTGRASAAVPSENFKELFERFISEAEGREHLPDIDGNFVQPERP